MAQTAPLCSQPPNLAVRTASPPKQVPIASPTLAFDDSKWAPRSAGASAATGAGWRIGDAEPFTKRGSTALYTSSEPDSWRHSSRPAVHAQYLPLSAAELSSHRQGDVITEHPFQTLHGGDSSRHGTDSTRRTLQPNLSTSSSSHRTLASPSEDNATMGSRGGHTPKDHMSTWSPAPQPHRNGRLASPSGILNNSFFASPASVRSTDLSYGQRNFVPSYGAFPSSHDRLEHSFQSMHVADDMSSFQRPAISFRTSPASAALPGPLSPLSRTENLSNPSFNKQAAPQPGGFIDFSTREAGLHPNAANESRVPSSVPQLNFRPGDRTAKPNANNSGLWQATDLRGQIPWRESQFTTPYSDLSETLPPASYPYHQGFSTPLTPYSMPQYGPQHIPRVGMPTLKDESEPSPSLRSPCLAEFRNSGGKNSKKWELRDIYDHVVEFSGDHHGSLFIQSKLEKAKTDEKEVLFREIQANAVPLMKDVFGNYVLQKFFEHGDHLQKRILVNSMRGQVPELSKHVYGCRVVQTAFNHILVEQQQALVKELESCVMDCVKNENGNHVIQIAIRLVPMEHLQPMIDQFYGHVHHLATHRYGCRIIQRLLESCKHPVLNRLLEELHECTPQLIVDTYGNYVPQHIVQFGEARDRNRIIEVVQRNLVVYSKQKFASNVVEKCVKYGVEDQRRQIMQQLLRQDAHEGHELLYFLIRDGYGNYVLQSLLDHLNDQDYTEFVQALEPALVKAREISPNKQSDNVAKKMQRFKTPRYGWNCPPSSGHQFGNYATFRGCAPPQINTSTSIGRVGSSTVSTPPLTVAGTESPVSNAFSNMTDIARQESTKDQREWRKDSAINFEDSEQTLNI